MKVGTISIEDKEYPALLKEIEAPPEKLFYRGDIKLMNERCFAIVGSRKCTLAGIRAAKLIAGRLAEAGITIVSGMAGGIDTAAHKGALSAGGKTIAVLGCGIDLTYPASNRELKREIEGAGLVISEYEAGVQAQPYFFPLRNRIISGISEGVVVCEAAIRSGSLITAEAAAEQGRSVYVVPGMFTMPGSYGCNRLVMDGAEPIYDVNEFVSGLGLMPEKKEADLSGLSDSEKKVYSLLVKRGELTADEIFMDTGISAKEVNSIITVLEIKGLVSTAMGKAFPAQDAI